MADDGKVIIREWWPPEYRVAAELPADVVAVQTIGDRLFAILSGGEWVYVETGAERFDPDEFPNFGPHLTSLSDIPWPIRAVTRDELVAKYPKS